MKKIFSLLVRYGPLAWSLLRKLKKLANSNPNQESK